MKTDNLTIYKIPTHSNEWYRFRTTGMTVEDGKKFNCDPYPSGVGSSEVGNVLYLMGDYNCPQRLYHEKIGTMTPKNESNEAMVLGLENEELIRNIWSCYDGTTWVDRFVMWKNAPPGTRRQHQLRRAKNFNGYIVNKKYPWLFISIDFLSENNTYSLTTGQIMPNGFPVEAKCINGMYAKSWINEVPRYQTAQVQQQMLVLELDYAELAILSDGRYFKCVPVEKDNLLQEEILDKTYKFWQRVLKGREYYQSYRDALDLNKTDDAEKIEAAINSNEPPIDNSKAVEDFLKERYRSDVESFKGGKLEYMWAKKYRFWGSIGKEAEEKQQLFKNHIMNALYQNKAQIIDFDTDGKVSFFLEGKKTSPTLRVSIKEKFDVIAKEEADKINANV